jgi:hypothetical protein
MPAAAIWVSISRQILLAAVQILSEIATKPCDYRTTECTCTGNHPRPWSSGHGTFTGTYSSNPDGTGTATLTLDAGITFKFAIVITDGGQGLQLVATGWTDSCDLGGIVVSGVARAALPQSPPALNYLCYDSQALWSRVQRASLSLTMR